MMSPIVSKIRTTFSDKDTLGVPVTCTGEEAISVREGVRKGESMGGREYEGEGV